MAGMALVAEHDEVFRLLEASSAIVAVMHLQMVDGWAERTDVAGAL